MKETKLYLQRIIALLIAEMFLLTSTLYGVPLPKCDTLRLKLGSHDDVFEQRFQTIETMIASEEGFLGDVYGETDAANQDIIGTPYACGELVAQDDGTYTGTVMIAGETFNITAQFVSEKGRRKVEYTLSYRNTKVGEIVWSLHEGNYAIEDILVTHDFRRDVIGTIPFAAHAPQLKNVSLAMVLTNIALKDLSQQPGINFSQLRACSLMGYPNEADPRVIEAAKHFHMMSLEVPAIIKNIAGEEEILYHTGDSGQSFFMVKEPGPPLQMRKIVLKVPEEKRAITDINVYQRLYAETDFRTRLVAIIKGEDADYEAYIGGDWGWDDDGKMWLEKYVAQLPGWANDTGINIARDWNERVTAQTFTGVGLVGNKNATLEYFMARVRSDPDDQKTSIASNILETMDLKGNYRKRQPSFASAFERNDFLGARARALVKRLRGDPLEAKEARELLSGIDDISEQYTASLRQIDGLIQDNFIRALFRIAEHIYSLSELWRQTASLNEVMLQENAVPLFIAEDFMFSYYDLKIMPRSHAMFEDILSFLDQYHKYVVMMRQVDKDDTPFHKKPEYAAFVSDIVLSINAYREDIQRGLEAEVTTGLIKELDMYEFYRNKEDLKTYFQTFDRTIMAHFLKPDMIVSLNALPQGELSNIAGRYIEEINIFIKTLESEIDVIDRTVEKLSLAGIPITLLPREKQKTLPERRQLLCRMCTLDGVGKSHNHETKASNGNYDIHRPASDNEQAEDLWKKGMAMIKNAKNGDTVTIGDDAFYIYKDPASGVNVAFPYAIAQMIKDGPGESFFARVLEHPLTWHNGTTELEPLMILNVSFCPALFSVVYENAQEVEKKYLELYLQIELEHKLLDEISGRTGRAEKGFSIEAITDQDYARVVEVCMMGEANVDEMFPYLCSTQVFNEEILKILREKVEHNVLNEIVQFKKATDNVEMSQLNEMFPVSEGFIKKKVFDEPESLQKRDVSARVRLTKLALRSMEHELFNRLNEVIGMLKLLDIYFGENPEMQEFCANARHVFEKWSYARQADINEQRKRVDEHHDIVSLYSDMPHFELIDYVLKVLAQENSASSRREAAELREKKENCEAFFKLIPKIKRTRSINRLIRLYQKEFAQIAHRDFIIMNLAEKDMAFKKMTPNDAFSLIGIISNAVTTARRKDAAGLAARITIETGEDTRKSLPFIKLKIANDGKGITKQQLETLFTGRATTKESGSGGNGWNLAWQAIKELGGDLELVTRSRSKSWHVWFDEAGEKHIDEIDEQFQGTRFTIWLPMDEQVEDGNVVATMAMGQMQQIMASNESGEQAQDITKETISSNVNSKQGKISIIALNTRNFNRYKDAILTIARTTGYTKNIEGIETFISRQKSAVKARRIAHKDETVSFIVLENSEVVGYLIGDMHTKEIRGGARTLPAIVTGDLPVEEQYVNIFAIGVAKNARNKGVGDRLLRRCAQVTRERNIPILRIAIRNTANESGKNFFEEFLTKRGFKLEQPDLLLLYLQGDVKEILAKTKLSSNANQISFDPLIVPASVVFGDFDVFRHMVSMMGSNQGLLVLASNMAEKQMVEVVCDATGFTEGFTLMTLKEAQLPSNIDLEAAMRVCGETLPDLPGAVFMRASTMLKNLNIDPDTVRLQ